MLSNVQQMLNLWALTPRSFIILCLLLRHKSVPALSPTWTHQRFVQTIEGTLFKGQILKKEYFKFKAEPSFQSHWPLYFLLRSVTVFPVVRYRSRVQAMTHLVRLHAAPWSRHRNIWLIFRKWNLIKFNLIYNPNIDLWAAGVSWGNIPP